MAAASAPIPPLTAEPSAPPSSSSSATSRASLLDHHATQLAHRSAALDLRAQELSQAEARLSQRSSALQTRTHALSRLETAARAEMASLLEALSARHDKLANSEARLSAREVNFRRKVAALRDTLRAATTVETKLKQRRTQLVDVEKRKAGLLNALQQAEQRLKRVETVASDAERRAENVAKEGETLRTAADRLELLEREVQRRDRDLAEKEKNLQQGQDRLERLVHCEALVEPLRRFVAEHAALVADTDPTHALDMPDGAAEDAPPEIIAADALAAVRHLSSFARSLHAQKATQQGVETRLEERERRVKKEESALRARERTVDAEEDRLGVTRDSLRAVQEDVDSAWASIEEARNELDTREENIRAKEAQVLQTEQNVRRKEKGLLQAEKMLVRRERSIRRAHAAVTEREKTIEQRQRDLDEEKTSLQNLKTTIDLKEDLIDTRELELAAREAKKNKALEVLLEASVEKSKRRSSREHSLTPDFSSTAPAASGTPELPNAAVRLHGGVEDEKRAESRQANDRATTLAAASSKPSEVRNGKTSTIDAMKPASVRRQLAFESTVQRETDLTSKDGSAMEVNTDPQPANTTGNASKRPGTKDDANGNDNESEAAAEDLLPELIGARALWKERVARLEAVVQNMQENTWAVKPHAQPLLTSVSARLQEIRSEIDSAPERSFESSKMSYGTEQQRQVRWGAQMREQLDAVRDVQAGMLIALNKEEDALISAPTPGSAAMERSESDTAPTTEPSEGTHENVSPTHGGEDESSVDVTLDATAAGLFPDHSLEVTEDFGTITSSFQKFRRQMRAQRGMRQSSRNRRVIGREKWREPSALLHPGPPAASTALIRDTPGKRGADLLQELASLRHELENITGSSNTSHA